MHTNDKYQFWLQRPSYFEADWGCIFVPDMWIQSPMPLLQVPLLRQLFMAEGMLCPLEKGMFLFHKGGISSAYMISRGSVVLIGPSVNQVSLMGHGSVLGLSESIAHAPHRFASYAVGKGVAYKLTAKELSKHFDKQPDLLKQCLQDMLIKTTLFE